MKKLFSSECHRTLNCKKDRMNEKTFFSLRLFFFFSLECQIHIYSYVFFPFHCFLIPYLDTFHSRVLSICKRNSCFCFVVFSSFRYFDVFPLVFFHHQSLVLPSCLNNPTLQKIRFLCNLRFCLSRFFRKVSIYLLFCDLEFLIMCCPRMSMV